MMPQFLEQNRRGDFVRARLLDPKRGLCYGPWHYCPVRGRV